LYFSKMAGVPEVGVPAQKKKRRRRRKEDRGTGVYSRRSGAVQCSYVPQFADAACQVDLISDWGDVSFIGSDEEEAEMRQTRLHQPQDVSYGRDLCSLPVPEGGVFGRDEYISSFREKNAERLSAKAADYTPPQSSFRPRRSYRRRP
jgi:hypothetical protein